MVAGVLIENLQPEDLYIDRLPVATQKGFHLCVNNELVSKNHWYLAGGTALSLQVGHRESVDLDFFTSLKQFDESLLERKLTAMNNWKTTLLQQGTLYGELGGTRMSFIAYPFFQPSDRQIHCGHVRMLVPEDIAAMKIIAISQRGRKRDFVDLYWYCRNREPLVAVIRRSFKQYPQDHNIPHIIKSLVYFADAESDPMPRVHFEADWQRIKAYFKKEVPILAKDILGLE